MTTTSIVQPRASAQLQLWGPLLATVPFLLWSYWPTLMELVATWQHNPQYQHGFLVPLFGAWFLYMRRERLDVSAVRPSIWGLVVLGAALLLRVVGVMAAFVSVDAFTLVPCLAGLVLLIGGWAAWRWAWPALLFLFFMIPLPYFASVAMAGSLQRIATLVSTFFLQMLGLPALAEGNIILLNEHQIGIVEACSGLRMMVVFFALATAVVMVTNRHWIDRVIIILSAAPIAMIANILRIVATGILYDLGMSDWANHFFHDVAGWMMMPLALGMLWLEVALLSALIIETPVSKRPYAATRNRVIQRSPIARSRRQQPSAQADQDNSVPSEVATRK
jgi:exosortase